MLHVTHGGNNAAAIATALGGKASGDSFKAHCPAHEDLHESLMLRDADGKTLVKCHAGCEQAAVIAVLKQQGLWSKQVREPKATDRVETAVYQYCDEAGAIAYEKVRYKPKNFLQRRPDGSGGYLFSLKGINQIPYRLPQIKQAIENGSTIYIVEGEKDADNLVALGLAATTNSGGAGKWIDDLSKYLFGAQSIVIIPDNDEAGRKHAETVASSLRRVAGIAPFIINLPALPDKGDVSDWLSNGGTKDQLLEIVAQGIEEATKQQANEWLEPNLFSAASRPDIPTSLLPAWLGEYVNEVTKSYQTPPALAVMLALPVVAACVQGRFRVARPNTDHEEPTNIWTATALPPGSRKSDVLKALREPIDEWERKQAKLLKPKIAEVNSRRKIQLDQISALQKKAVSLEDDSDRETVIKRIAALESNLPDQMSAPKLWTSDSTPERTQGLLAEHDERMAILSDEGGCLEVAGGLYNKGNGCNIDVYLQGHAGGSMRIDRNGRTVSLARPALTIGLAVQENVIERLNKDSKSNFRGTGMLARFLYCIPDSNIGKRNVRSQYQIDHEKRTRYQQGITELLELPLIENQGRIQPEILTLGPDAHECWLQFAEYIEANQGKGKRYEQIQDWTAKLCGAAMRIAGLMHLVHHGRSNLVISRETMESALELCALLICHAEHAFDLMSLSQSYRDAKFLFEWILEGKRTTFKKTDARRAGGRFTKQGQGNRLDTALAILQDRHIIGAVIKDPTPKNTLIFEVNPKLYISKENPNDMA